MNLDTEQWTKEIISHKTFFQTLEQSLPIEFMNIQEKNFVNFSEEMSKVHGATSELI